MGWKTRVRYFLAWSSAPPCLAVYRWLYRVATRMAVEAFRRQRGVVAVYLSRGGAKKEITPGVSDIDFIVIAGPDVEARRQVETVFRRLQTLSAGLIPYHPTFVLDERELQFLWRTHPYRRYRFEEGKANWRLLYGTDVMGTLPEMSEAERTTACFAEMNYWWVLFADFMLQNESCRGDQIIRRSICVKAVAELANALRALRTGEFCYSRAEALRREDTALCRRLADAMAPRVPRRDPELEEGVYRYLVTSFLELWDSFGERPFLPVQAEVAQTVEPASEEMDALMEQPAFGEIRRHLAEAWGPKCLGVRLLKSAYYPLDCHLLVIDGDRANLPALADLERLMAVRKRAYAGQRAAYFVLRAGGVGFPLTPIMTRDLIRGVLTPATAPDVFLQLGVEPVYWTSHTRWFLSEWGSNGQWLEAPAAKERQLEAIARSAGTGHVHYPLRAPEAAQ